MAVRFDSVNPKRRGALIGMPPVTSVPPSDSDADKDEDTAPGPWALLAPTVRKLVDEHANRDHAVSALVRALSREKNASLRAAALLFAARALVRHCEQIYRRDLTDQSNSESTDNPTSGEAAAAGHAARSWLTQYVLVTGKPLGAATAVDVELTIVDRERTARGALKSASFLRAILKAIGEHRNKPIRELLSEQQVAAIHQESTHEG